MGFSSEQLSLGLIISCAIFALTPILLTTGSESIKPADSLTSQDHVHYVADSPLMIYSICIVAIPVADLFLDFVSHLFNDVSVQRCAHLSLTERLLFLTGIALQSSKYFMRNITNSSALSLVNNCIDNTNGLLLIGPIVLFLGRCASNFTATKSLYVIFLFVGGIVCRTLYHFSGTSSAVQQGFSSTGAFIFISGCVLYGSLVSQCIATNLGNNFLTMASRQKFIYRICEVFRAKFKDSDESSETKDANECDCYANCLASLHMILSWIILVGKISSNLSHRTEYVLLLAEVLVLIIESRIRKFEIARDLVRNDHDPTQIFYQSRFRCYHRYHKKNTSNINTACLDYSIV